MTNPTLTPTVTFQLEHSKLPPSRAARRMACPGSRALEEKYPSHESALSEEGTLAHKYAVCLITRTAIETELQDEMRDAVLFYVQNILDIHNSISDATTQIECRVDMKNIHNDMWGTCDVWTYDEKEKTLYVSDFKYGRKYVEVFENWQLLAYAVGIHHALCLSGKAAPEKIILRIIQPRCFQGEPIREWSIDNHTLEKYRLRLVKSEYEATQPDARLRPSSQCEYCTARHACPALASTTAAIISDGKTMATFDLSNESLGFELKKLHEGLKLIEAIITGLEEEVKHKLKQGEQIPHYSLGFGEGRLKWKVSQDEILAVGKMFNCDLAKPQEAITPTQAIKTGIPREIIDNYSERTQSELKLIQQTENKIKKMFTQE